MLKVALVGRTNVGKSTLFNRLTRKRDALVADEAGVTRDRRYGWVESAGKRWLLIDTGGLSGDESEGPIDDAVVGQVAVQTEWAIAEADLICFVADAREGLTGADETVVQRLRRAGKQTWLVVNKTDGCDEHAAQAEFAPLGLASCFPTAAVHGRGVGALRDALAEQVALAPESSVGLPSDGLRVAFLGRPNVGKSTLLNRLLGEERMLTDAAPGTTRDSIAAPFVFQGRDFVLVDTAGVRRRSKVSVGVEKFSVLKTLESIVLADVVVLVCSAADGVTTQDASLADKAVAAGRALVVAVNKSDLLGDDETRHKLERSLDLGLRFLRGVEVLKVSALRNQGMESLMRAVRRAHESALVQVPTPACTKLLRSAVERNPPPASSGARAKLRYAHQGGNRPPRFIVYGSRVDALPASYRRYLENFFRERLKLVGTPVLLEFRRTPNRFVRPQG